MNVLLPGTVWLLVSVLAGCIVISRMETNAITVILFVAVTLVMFVVPITVYMEYREQIEKWFSKRNQNTTPAVGTHREQSYIRIRQCNRPLCLRISLTH